MVVNIPLVYNAIIGQPTLNNLMTVVSTYHMVMKYPRRTSIRELRNNPNQSCKCYLTMISLSKKAQYETPSMDSQNFAKSLPHMEMMEFLIKAPLNKAHPNKLVKIEAILLEEKLA